jgi:hypothetical protein
VEIYKLYSLNVTANWNIATQLIIKYDSTRHKSGLTGSWEAINSMKVVEILWGKIFALY